MSKIFTTVFVAADIKMRYKEPFVTEGLNAKLAVNTPRGIYRGFRLAPDVANRTIKIVADATTTDHVAVYEINVGNPALQRLSLTLRKTGGDFSLDLNDGTLNGNTVVIALYATYVVGSTTAAEVRVYTLAEYNALAASLRAELVVLGTCLVPAGATPIVTFDHDLRTMAWSEAAGEAVQWSPVIRNPSFEWGVTAATYRFAISDWENLAGTNGTWRLANSTANSRTGTKHLEYNATGGAATGLLAQPLEIPVQPGRLVRLQAHIRVLIAPTVSALTRLRLVWGDADSVDTGLPTDTVLVTVGSTDASYRRVEKIVTVPAGVFFLKSAQLRLDAQTFGAAGVALRMDDVQLYVETGGPAALPGADDVRANGLHADSLVLEDQGPTFSVGQLAALARFDKTTPASEGRVVVERRDQVAGSLPPALEVMGRLFLGANLLGTEANALLPRITAKIATTAGIDFTLLWESARDDATGSRVRFYGDPAGAFFVTVNAVWNTPSANLWNKDVAGVKALKTSFRPTQFVVEARVTDAAWSDAAWENNVITADATGTATTAAQVSLPGQIVSVGSELVASASDARIARMAGSLRTDAAVMAEPTLLQQWLATNGFGLRVYAAHSTFPVGTGNLGQLFLVFNASWNGTNWIKDQTAFPAARLAFTEGAFGASGAALHVQWLSGVGPFTEANWDLRFGSARLNNLYIDNDNQPGTGTHVYIQSHGTGTSGQQDQKMHLAVSPSLRNFFSAAPNFVIDDLGIPRFMGGWLIEEFVQTAASASWTGTAATFNYQTKSRVRLVGTPSFLETTGGVSLVELAGFSADVLWENVTGSSWVGYVDATTGVLDFGFVQDSATYGDENLRVAIRTTAGLEVQDTGVNIASNLNKWFVLRVYNTGGSPLRLQWTLGLTTPDAIFAAGIFQPSVSTLATATTSRKFRFHTAGAGIMVVERCQLFSLTNTA